MKENEMGHPGRELEELVSAYWDEEASPEERDVVEAALRDHPEAERLLADQRALSYAIQSSLELMGEEADFSGFADGVMARIEAAERSTVREAAPGLVQRSLGQRLLAAASELIPKRRAPWLAGAAGAAALGAAVIALSPGVMGGGGMERVLLAGDPADAMVLSMNTQSDHNATLFKTTGGTTIIYVTGRE